MINTCYNAHIYIYIYTRTINMSAGVKRRRQSSRSLFFYLLFSGDVDFLIKKEKKYVCTFPLRCRANRDVSFGASFCFALVFRTLFTSQRRQSFHFRARPRTSFSPMTRRNLCSNFYSREILYLPSARPSLSLSLSDSFHFAWGICVCSERSRARTR